jgi:TetR/AcrR family fatty acid metabolism transcriptional regulator
MRDVARRQDIKDLILDAADRFLNQFGYKKMTMDNLAHEVGIAKGTLYLHFSGKEELVLAHIDRIKK